MKEILRLHVPGHPKYTRLVEEFMQSAAQYIYPEDEQMRSKLCAVMNEVFGNIVRHSDTSRIDELVRIQLEIGARTFLLSIYDHGPGIEIDGQYPPYTRDLIGKREAFRRVIDGTVFISVLDPYSVSFQFEKHEQAVDYNSMDELEQLNGHGYGISIVTKIMDSLIYSYSGEGNFDWQMVKKLE